MATIYYVVNTSLKMSAGKVAAQCCHVNTEIVLLMERQSKLPQIYREWRNTGETTIVLRANDEEFTAIFNEFNGMRTDSSFARPIMLYQTDAGRTQVEPGTITVLGFTPMHKDSAPESLKKLKLL